MKKKKITKNKYGLGSWLKGTYDKFEDTKVGGVATDLAKANMSMGVSALGIDPGFKYKNEGIGKVAGVAGKVNQAAAKAAAGILLPGVGGEAVGAVQGTGTQMSNELNQEKPPSMMGPPDLPRNPYDSFENGGFREINNGGTHETNPHEGVPIGPDDLVEEGEVISKLKRGDYVFSNRLNFDKKNTFADRAKKIKRQYKRVNDKTEEKDLQEELENLAEIAEPMRQQAEQKEQNKFLKKFGGKTKHAFSGTIDNPPTTRDEALATGRLPVGADVSSFEKKKFNDVTSYSKKGASNWTPSESDTRKEYDLAYGAARKAGLQEFDFRDKKYSTDMAGEDEVYHTQDLIDPLQPMGIEASSPDISKLGLKESGTGIGVTPWNDALNLDIREPDTTNIDNALEQDNLTGVPNRGWKQGLVGALPAAAGGLYNIFSAKKDEVNYDRVRPEEISLARERETARRRGSNTGASITSAIMKGGRPSSAAMIAGRTAVDRGTGEQVGKSYMNEETYNAGARERAGFTNAGIQMKETEAQAMEDAAYQQRIDAGVGSIANAATSYGQSVQQGGAWADYLNASRSDDGYGAAYNPNTKDVTTVNKNNVELGKSPYAFPKIAGSFGYKKFGGYRKNTKK